MILRRDWVMLINNQHPEDISIVIDGITHTLAAHSTKEVMTPASSVSCQIVHNPSITDWSETLTDTILKRFSGITAIIVDSKYSISAIKEDSELTITNEFTPYPKDDIGIIYHGVICQNAKIELVDCYSSNAKKVFSIRKLLLLLDANDFPIISPIVGVARYKRLKKLVSKQNLWQLLSSKTTGQL